MTLPSSIPSNDEIVINTVTDFNNEKSAIPLITKTSLNEINSDNAVYSPVSIKKTSSYASRIKSINHKQQSEKDLILSP